ncbi:MAG TPA: glycosyltransferase family 2 protein [Polyangiaceae bacterium]|nr:glycosyltransferase family 2 protein [Polyangiaceae bacterium]
MSSAPPIVSVIIASYNRADDLRLCLQALSRSRISHEVIAVDNASTDHALQVIAEFPDVRLVANPDNRGFAVANNQGLELAKGRYVALVNNDAVLDENWLGIGAQRLDEQSDLAAVGGKFFLWNDEQPVGDRNNHFYGPAWIRWFGDTPQDLDDPSPARYVPTLNGAGVMVRRRAIDDVGAPFLDPKFFMYFEETDFFARCIRRGFRLRYEPQMECWHRVRASTAAVPYRYYFQVARNLGIFAARHFDALSLGKTRYKLAKEAAHAWLTRGVKPGRLTEEQRAWLDAWRWLRENARDVAADRARYLPGLPTYQAALRDIERANAAR